MVGQMEARAATRETQEPVEAACLMFRLIIDCPTSWGSELDMVRRFLPVGGAVPAALSAYYHYTGVPSHKPRDECPTLQEQDALTQLVTFLDVVGSASISLGSESATTSSIVETVY